MPVPVIYCVHDDYYYLAASIGSFATAGPVFVFVSRVSWAGTPGDWWFCALAAKRAGATVVIGDWLSEGEHREATVRFVLEKGYSYFLMPDSDELIEARLLDRLCREEQDDHYDVIRVNQATYWKDASHVIAPPERFRPTLLVNAETASYVGLREYRGSRETTLDRDAGILHHLSYVGPDERVVRKTTTWSHRNEVTQGWLEQIWFAWNDNNEMCHLHPTHPEAYGRARLNTPLRLLQGVPSIQLRPRYPLLGLQ